MDLTIQNRLPKEATAQVQRPRLEALTTLRFLAALHVVLFHLRVEGILSGGPWWYQNFAAIGYVGVDFFFVLSGFILVYTYNGTGTSPRRFWQARFARIYPAYIVSLLLTAPFFFFALRHLDLPFFEWSKQHLALACILTLGLLQAWIPQAALAWNPVCWSLSVEAFFYSIFPPLLKWTGTLSRHRLTASIAGFCAISFAFSLVYLFLHPDGLAVVNSGATNLFWKNVLSFNPLVRLPEFAVGMLTAQLFMTSSKSYLPAGVFVTGGFLGFVALVLCAARIPSSLISPGLFSPAYAAIIYGLALRPKWAAVLEMKWLVLLGNASYSLYLLHSIVISWTFGATLCLPHWLSVAAVLIAAVGASLLSYLTIERPARRLFYPKKRG